MQLGKRWLAWACAITCVLPRPSGAQTTADRFARPTPRYLVRVDSSVTITMRDGVRLSTDIYFPVGAGDRFPAVLIRTPYGKGATGNRNDAEMFGGQGYVVAVQDLRGKHESEGEYVQMSGRDPDDGYETLTWLAAQPWSNGRIGTYGCSYLGETQIALAARRHPNHTAAIAKAAGGNYAGKYTFFGQYEGGVLELAGAFGWAWGSGGKLYYRPPPGLSRTEWLSVKKYFTPAPRLPEPDYARIVWSLPVAGMMTLAGAPPNDFNDFISHAPGDAWWHQFGYTWDTDRFDVPVLHVDSWYNGSIEEQLDLFNLMGKNAASPRGAQQFAIISPTTHCGSEGARERTVIGEREVGDARFEHYAEYLRWFDYWLKGTENGVTTTPRLRLYVMGDNRWRPENEWPLTRMRPTRYYLRSGGRANSRFGTGALATAPPSREPPDRFVYDPATPVPSKGGSLCCTGNPAQQPGSFDQSDVEARNDVLVYTTAVLDQGLELTGPIEVVLHVASSARDTDFSAKLVDVYPDGRAYNIQSGITRARYRDGFDRPVWMQPGQVYRVRINLHVTSNYFGPGHRVRLEISSSDFPRFDRNLNTGGDNFTETGWQVAENVVHHSEAYPSHVVLPVVPR